MKKITYKEKLQYRFDNLMSKGSIALIGVLFLATAIVAIFVAIFLLIFNNDEDGTFSGNVWISIMHIIDAGTITGASTNKLDFLVLMSIATICGLFVTSILIGLITTGFESKLQTLKKGNSRVIEKDHTIILGFNNSIYTLISELITANENEKKRTIVILAEEDKETIETLISDHIEDFKTTKIVCRTGNISDINMLKRCSIETSRSIIINETDDFKVIKSILAINNHLNTTCENNSFPHIVCTVRDYENYDAIQLISNNNVEAILVDDSISRIIAQTCRQPGLTNVLFELFDFDGDDLYFENFKELNGKKFGDVLNSFNKAVVMGYKRGENLFVKPDMDSILNEQDELLLLMSDNGAEKVQKYNPTDVSSLVSNMQLPSKKESVLIIGANRLTSNILCELDDFFVKGSKVILANSTIDKQYKNLSKSLNNIKLEFCELDIDDSATLTSLLENSFDYLLILSDDLCDEETSDAKTLVKLVNIRHFAQSNNKSFSVTSELKIVQNQKLARIAQVNDLVIGSDVINLLLTQISENRFLSKVFKELLTAEGSEIYIKPAENYVILNKEMTFYELTEILKKENEIAIGYKKKTNNDFEVITNPRKSDKIIFKEGDSIITLSED